MDKQVLFDRIKESRQKKYINNLYNFDCIEKADSIWENDNGFIFSYNDHGIERLIFFALNYEVLDNLLLTITSGKFYLEFMANSFIDYIPQNVIPIARMKRLANADCSSILCNPSVKKYKGVFDYSSACSSDINDIYNLLWTTFNTEVSHLPYKEEIEKNINQYSIHRNSSGLIDALLQADIMPKKFYINQIINTSNDKIVHSILFSKIENYINSGGKYIYSWVENDNIASMKFHEKFGLKHDGMCNLVYCLER